MSHCMQNRQYVIIFYRSDFEPDRVALVKEGGNFALPCAIMEEKDTLDTLLERAFNSLETQSPLVRRRLPIFAGVFRSTTGIDLVSLYQVEVQPEGVEFAPVSALPESMYKRHKEVVTCVMNGGWLRANSYAPKLPKRQEA